MNLKSSDSPILLFAALLSIILVGLLGYVMIAGPDFQANTGSDVAQGSPSNQATLSPGPEAGTFRASHVLIAYAGADRAAGNVTRSKAEAEALAAEVSEKAQAEGADFAALAREFSDGPSSVKGGDLGKFEYSEMVGPFSAATAELEIGGVSGPVETGFGYHVILRKE